MAIYINERPIEWIKEGSMKKLYACALKERLSYCYYGNKRSGYYLLIKSKDQQFITTTCVPALPFIERLRSFMLRFFIWT